MIEFSDGMKFDTQSELHVEKRSDGYYVVGEGLLLPVNSREEADEEIKKLKERKKSR
jgi:hypothetical protein